MNAKDRNIEEFVRGEDTYFVVPYYQRKYIWNVNEQVEEFYNDINNFIEQQKSNDYFLGAMITKTSMKNQNKEIILVDGQQRITTFLILISSLIASFENRTKELSEDESIFIFDLKGIIKSEYKFKLQRINDENILQRILKGETYALENSDSNYLKVFRYFEKQFKNLTFDQKKQLYLKGLKRIKIAVIDLNEKDDEHLVFESFNSKGKKLNSSELIKNYIVMSLEKNNSDNENICKEFENKFLESFDNSIDIDDFWRQYIALETGKLVTKKSKMMYYDFKKIFDTNAIDVSFIEKLINFKLIWDYINQKNEFPTKNQIIFKSVLLTYYPIIHSIISRNSIVDNGELLLQNLNNINYGIDYIGQLVVARTICAFTRAGSAREWAKIGHKLFIDKDDDFIKSFDKNVINHLSNSKKEYRFPEWEELEISIENKKNLYQNLRNQLKWIFITLEEYESGVKKSEEELKKLQIEHIFPQKPTIEQSKEWNINVDENDKWEFWINTLGNLSISEINQKLGNKSYEEKKEILKKSSYLKINKFIYEIEKWNEETVKQRAKSILQNIKKIWKFD